MRIINAIVISMLAALVWHGAPQPCPGQDQGKPEKIKPAPDEFREILKQVEEAYKAVVEVDKDVLDELRKQYRDPKPEREAKIFREIRRLYDTTPQDEEAILREIRLAYQQPTNEQEERVFAAIRRAPQHPLGTVPIQVQAEAAAKLFRKLDADGDGYLNGDEMSQTLYEQRGRWDRNRDLAISFEEYGSYYQGQLRWISDGVASGEIPARLPRGLVPAPSEPESGSRRTEDRPANRDTNEPRESPLPEWFTGYDLDGDGQVGLYEWKKFGQSIKAFQAMDRNSDGFVVAEELRRYLAEQAGSGG